MKLSDLPVGSLIKDSYGVGTQYLGQYIVWRVLEHGHTGDPTGSTALECRDIISLKAFDAKEPNNSYTYRQKSGNNRYLYSNLLQWLNSDASSNWYTAQHSADQSPDSTSYVSVNPYTSEVGFLTNFSTKLKESLMTTSKITVKNTTDGGGSETVSSKVWLLSTTEIGLANENNIAEGSIYAYYSADNQNSRRIKNIATTAAIGNYSNSSCVAGAAWYWWLRTPYVGEYYHSAVARRVGTNGSNDGGDVYYGNQGVSPAICISSDLEVALDTTDNIYYIVWPFTKDIKKIYVNNNGVTKCIENRDLVHPFATATDAQLKAMLDAYYADELSWEDMGWNVGDTRLIHLNSMTAPNPYSGNWDAQDITVVIVAHDHTDLATAINGHTKACITVQTRECMNNESVSYHASTNTLNGHIYANGDSSLDMTFSKWANLYLRTYLNNNTITNDLPQGVLAAIPTGDFKSAIKQSKHRRHDTYNGSTSEEVTDTLFLPAYPEIFGTSSYSYYAVTNPVEGTQWKYYETAANTLKYGNNGGVSNGKVQYWWNGSASSSYLSNKGYRWCNIDTNGAACFSSGDSAAALAPAWCM